MFIHGPPLYFKRILGYYSALNNTLNHDRASHLRRAMPLIQHMCHALCCLPDGTPRRYERDTRVWKGDVQRARMLNTGGP